MTISITGTGGWATRAGVCGRLLNNLNGILAATAPDTTAHWGSSGPTIGDLATQINAIEAQFQSSNQQIVDGLYAARDAARFAFDGIKSTLQLIVQNTFIRMADDDVGLPSQTITAALQEIVRQLNNSSDSVKAPTITATPASGTPSPTGNPTVCAGLKDPDGHTLDYVYNEVLDLVVTADSFSGGATAGRETLSVTGDAKEGSMLSWNWPKGSGANTSLAACDAAENAGANLLTNGSFDTWSSNTPGTWTISTGASTVTAEASDIYGSSGKALKITGDGSTLTLLKQEVTSLVTAREVLALNAFVHVEGTAPGAGKIRFALVDGSGTVINDNAGTANSYTVDLTQTTLQTTYKATGAMTSTELDANGLSGGGGKVFFRLPSNMPAAVWVEIKVTTAITNTKLCYVDHVALVKATQAYGNGVAGGPYLAAFSGSTKMVLNDRYKVTVSNNYGSAMGKFLWRAFDLPTLGVWIPSSGSNTINENLIT
jgi:hypothetical protein